MAFFDIFLHDYSITQVRDRLHFIPGSTEMVEAKRCAMCEIEWHISYVHVELHHRLRPPSYGQKKCAEASCMRVYMRCQRHIYGHPK